MHSERDTGQRIPEIVGRDGQELIAHVDRVLQLSKEEAAFDRVADGSRERVARHLTLEEKVLGFFTESSVRGLFILKPELWKLE